MSARNFFDNLARKVGGKAPENPIGRRVQRALLTERSIRGVLELAVRLGETMLSLGATSSDVTEIIRRTTRAFGVECQVDLTFTSILVVYDGVEEGPGISLLRVVESRTADYDRLARVIDLARDVATDPRDIHVADTIDDPKVRDQALQQLEGFHERLDKILLAPQRYRRVIITLFYMLMAAGVALLLGGGPLVVLIAAATTAVIDVTVQALARWGLPTFFLQVAGASIATGVAVLLLLLVPVLPVDFAALPPSLVVASGIVVLLAGMSLVGAADDAINGFPLTASGRLLEVFLLTLGIVVGIAFVLEVARTAGVDLVLVEREVQPWPSVLEVLGAGVAAGAWALASYSRPRAAAIVAVFGAVAYLAYDLLSLAGHTPLVASTLPALFIGFFGEALSRRFHVPAIITTVCGTVPLLPGLSIYQGMLDITSNTGTGQGAQLLMQAGMIGVGLAGGVTLGKYLARQLGRRKRPQEQPATAMTKQEFRGTTATGPATTSLFVLPDAETMELAVGLQTGRMRIVTAEEVSGGSAAAATAAGGSVSGTASPPVPGERLWEAPDGSLWTSAEPPPKHAPGDRG